MLLACSSSSTDKSTGSNWLACAVDADCAAVSGSSCADDGYCVDTAGDHVADPAASGGSSAGGSSSGGSTTAGAGAGGATNGGATSGGASGGGGAGTGCTVDGTSYEPGATFPASDDCNTCTCQAGGTVTCTRLPCPTQPPDAGQDTCSALEGQRAAELDAIQSCTSDADCGQVLTGTSCGCTRNLVARNDADITTFQDIQAQLSDNGCDTGASTCDCPEADGFACEAGTCTWNYTTPSCPPECFRAIQCVQTCGDTPQDYGCCPCPSGWIDTIQCP
jgi:hypothetical protein